MEKELAEMLTSYAIKIVKNTMRSRLEEINLDSNRKNLNRVHKSSSNILNF